ncbi:MAG: DUF2064 domain-containing protein [Coriobacteriales bacterium]|jgi:glycosyltransferase A (GT-A) superfamily protein (DUF2064 family)|nr:DUF2064 domain-containing protein [Coriobacteriales bacterium]
MTENETNTISRRALLLFCKPPVPGMVKTRLTKERGGNLTAEQAADFFRCSLLDVTDLGLLALDDLESSDALSWIGAEATADTPKKSYDFFISSTAPESLQLLQEMYAADWGDAPPTRQLNYIVDRGTSFDEHFDDAFNQIFERGYEQVVAIGGDMPLLPREHIPEAFGWLDYLSDLSADGSALVLAPCQQSGVSLVGLTRTTPINSTGVYYNRSGLPVLDAYTAKLQEVDVPSAFLAPVSDVDGDEDLAHAISCLNAIAEAQRYQPRIYLAVRTLDWIDRMNLKASAPPNDEHDPRQYLDGQEPD